MRRNLGNLCLTLACVWMLAGCALKGGETKGVKKIANGEMKRVELTVQDSFTEFPDSSFFKDITCMSVHEGKLYMFDAWRSDVAMWDRRNDRFLTFGSRGQGPREVADPKTFYVKDNKVAIMDVGFIKVYDEQGGVELLHIPRYDDQRFFIEKDTVYITAALEKTFYVKYPTTWKRADGEKGLQLCGSLLDITDGMKRSRNNRHLLKGDGCLYAVCPSFPVVEKYDLHTNELLLSCDLSGVDLMEDILSYVKDKNSPSSYHIYFPDAYSYQKKLYILCANWTPKNERNKILVLDEDLSPLGIYQLPGVYYTSFCVDDEFIYAANGKDCAVEMLTVDKRF